MAFFEKIKDAFEIEDTYQYKDEITLAKLALDNGGNILPLIVPAELTNGTGLMNPSILIHEGKLIVNIRQTNYAFYHSENKKFPHPRGHLTYIHPEDDMKLRTENFYCELNDKLEITRSQKVDTSLFDREPMWEFVGLEDASLVYKDINSEASIGL